jgi:hypothetical protein
LQRKKQAGSQVPASSIHNVADDALPDNQRAKSRSKRLANLVSLFRYTQDLETAGICKPQDTEFRLDIVQISLHCIMQGELQTS